MNRVFRAVSTVAACLMCVVLPQAAFATEVDNVAIKPHPGLTVSEDGKHFRIDLTKYDLHGNVIIIGKDYEVYSYYE